MIGRMIIFTPMFHNISNAKFSTENSNTLTHVDLEGKVKMVDVSLKQPTVRIAEAEARVYLGPTAFKLVEQNKIKKGDVISVAHIAGIMAVKKTIPSTFEVSVKSHVKTIGRTGAEIEAMTSAAIAALTIYDMCKAVSRNIIIKSIKLLAKSGGKEDFKASES